MLSSTPDAFPVVDSNAESEELLLSTDLLTCKYRQRTKINDNACKKKRNNYTELHVQKCLAEQEPEYSLTFHLLILNIQVSFLSFNFFC